MALITYDDKDKTLPEGVPRHQVRDVDMNEIKSVVNTNAGLTTAAQSNIDTHEALTNNPHNVTKTQVGLGNVDNTSDATKNTATATLTNKTLTAPVINSPTGLVKGDVGLGNVDNTSDATKLAAVFAKFVFKETPTGTINGVNDDFTLAFAAVTVIGVYGDGTVINSANYTVVGTALTITNALVIPTNSLQIDYIK